MSNELFMAAHEDLIEEYMAKHPDADWNEAYEATADGAYGLMVDRLRDHADYLRKARREGHDRP